MRPNVVLALGRVPVPPGTVLIDYRHSQFVKDGLAAPYRSNGNLDLDIIRNPALWKSDYASMPYSRLSPMRFKILAAILASRNDTINHDDFYEAIWGDDPTGGPENLYNYLAVTFCSFFTHPVSKDKIRYCDWLGFRVSSKGARQLVIQWKPQRMALAA